jgi:hypothetical protein
LVWFGLVWFVCRGSLASFYVIRDLFVGVIIGIVFNERNLQSSQAGFLHVGGLFISSHFVWFGLVLRLATGNTLEHPPTLSKSFLQ